MDWLTQRSGAKQQALLSSKTETPNKTGSVQEPHCCKEPFSSQVQAHDLPRHVSAVGSRGRCCVSGAEERGWGSFPVKTTNLKKNITCSETIVLLVKSILIKRDSETGICAPLIQTTFSPLGTGFLECQISRRVPASVPGSLLSWCCYLPFPCAERSAERSQLWSQDLDPSSHRCEGPHHAAAIACAIPDIHFSATIWICCA